MWTVICARPPKPPRRKIEKRGDGDRHKRRRIKTDTKGEPVTATPSKSSSLSPLPSPINQSLSSEISSPCPSPLNRVDETLAPQAISSIPPPPLSYVISPANNPPIIGVLGARLRYPHLGITATSTWTNASVITAKVELEDVLAAGVKAEYIGTFAPKTGLKAQKGNLYFKQGAFHARAFGEFTPATGNVNATVDGVVAHEGFLVGGEAGFDVQKAALTRYAAAFGYQTPAYSAAITATNSLSIFAASYYHRVNPAVEAGVKAAYDTKSNSTVGIEVATKYKIDPTAFAKVKLNDRGIVSLAYNAKINSGFTFGIGASLDAQKLNEAGHKIGTSFVFEG
jgi:voltage-dependent anion channel protein 2